LDRADRIRKARTGRFSQVGEQGATRGWVGFEVVHYANGSRGTPGEYWIVGRGFGGRSDGGITCKSAEDLGRFVAELVAASGG
jgi:hypothetical protein